MGKWVNGAGIAALVAFAVYLRVDALAGPNYWYDEAITSLRVAGHTERQVAAYATAHPIFALGDLEQFVSVRPATGYADTVHSLTTEDPQHTPLYYVMARAWASMLGNSVAAGRGLAALASILALPAMYWLCLELFVRSGAFASRLVCWLGVTAMALSPFQVAMAREHREYSLLTLTFAIACASFLRALRRQDAAGWALFAVAMTATVYTHMVSLLGLGACAAFLLVRERFRLSRPVLGFTAASVACGLAFVPWLLVLRAGRNTATSGLGWVQNFSQGRLQFGFSFDPVLRVSDISVWEIDKLIQGLPAYRLTHWIYELTPMLILITIWRLGRPGQRSCAGFATALICSVSLTLFIADFFTGSTSGWAYRYSTTSNLGWLLALAMVMAAAMEHSGRWKTPGRAAVGIFVLIAGWSAWVTHEQRHTWAKAFDNDAEIADSLSIDSQANLLTDDFVGGILALRPQTRADLPVSWRPRCYTCARVLEPLLDIPNIPGTTGQFYYFRSWINVPANRLQPLIDTMAGDRLGDPRFHTQLIRLTDPSSSFFLLTPR